MQKVYRDTPACDALLSVPDTFLSASPHDHMRRQCEEQRGALDSEATDCHQGVIPDGVIPKGFIYVRSANASVSVSRIAP